MKLLSLEVKKSAGKFSSKSSSKSSENSSSLVCEIVAFISKDGKPTLAPDYATYQDLLDQMHTAGELSLKAGAQCLVRFQGLNEASHVLFVNVGQEKRGIDFVSPSERLRRMGATLAQKLSAEKISSAEVCLDSFFLSGSGIEIDAFDASQSFAEGMWLATYQFKKYFSSGDQDPICPAIVKFSSIEGQFDNAFHDGIEAARIVADCTYICRDLSNEPSNELTPEDLAQDMQTIANQYKLKFSTFDEKKLKAEGAGLLLGVGQGSENPPRMIVMEYNPGKKARKTLALVGKGVTFDTGGISLKPGARMEDMKHDMSGAATVIGATVAIARMKLPIRVICVVAAAENMPDGKAICPGHVLKSRSGKTVEVNNTDAEGRLILADALDWVQDQKPDYVINAATLTGAIGIALGKICAGLMGNDDDLNLAICEASEMSGERVWELPIYSEYFDDLKSEFADMRNVGDNPGGGAIRGGIFLKQFIREGTRWAHLDIASMAFENGVVPYNPRRGANGWGVRLLIDTARLLAAEQEE